MNIFSEIILPSVIILIANVFSREYGSYRYEVVTAIFGWIAGSFLTIWLLLSITYFILVLFNSHMQLLYSRQITFQVFALSLVTVLSRDYEKLLKPKAEYFEGKIKLMLAMIAKKMKR